MAQEHINAILDAMKKRDSAGFNKLSEQDKRKVYDQSINARNALKEAGVETPSYLANGTAYVDALRGHQTAQQQSRVNELYDQMQASQLAQLRSQQQRATQQLNQQKDEFGQQIYGQKNQASVNNAQAVQRLREVMAANGLSASGENVTAQTSLGNQRQASLNALDQQENSFNRDIANRLAEVNDPMREQAIIAQIQAQRAQALMNADNTAFNQSLALSQFNAENDWRNTQFGYQQQRDQVADNRYDQQWQYQVGRDQVADQRYDQQWQFQQEQWQYQQARDQIQDERWKKEFDEDVRRFGLQFGLQKQVQLGNLSIAQANASLAQSKFAYQQQRDAIADQRYNQELAMRQAQTGGIEDVNLNTFMDRMVQTYSRPDPNNYGQTILDKDAMFDAILGLNLNDNQTMQFINTYGLQEQYERSLRPTPNQVNWWSNVTR